MDSSPIVDLDPTLESIPKEKEEVNKGTGTEMRQPFLENISNLSDTHVHE